MKNCFLLFSMIMVFISNSCTIPSTDVQTTKISETSTAGLTTPANSAPVTPTIEFTDKKGVYENNIYSFTIPEGWGLTLSQGEHYDLGVQKKLTIHNKTQPKNSVAFFTIASASLSEGESIETRFAQAYKKGPAIENAVSKPYENGALTGIELSYGRPWGEPRWIFRDIWLEKDGVVYVLAFQSYPDSFETFASTFDAILASFTFKQSQSDATQAP